MTRELAAYKIQAAVCNAICSRDPETASKARAWMNLNDGSEYLDACKLTGVNASELLELVLSAIDIEKPKLYLVQRTKP